MTNPTNDLRSKRVIGAEDTLRLLLDSSGPHFLGSAITVTGSFLDVFDTDGVTPKAIACRHFQMVSVLVKVTLAATNVLTLRGHFASQDPTPIIVVDTAAVDPAETAENRITTITGVPTPWYVISERVAVATAGGSVLAMDAIIKTAEWAVGANAMVITWPTRGMPYFKLSHKFATGVAPTLDHLSVILHQNSFVGWV